MKKLDPKAVWLFFITYCQRWFWLIIIIGFSYSKLFDIISGEEVTSPWGGSLLLPGLLVLIIIFDFVWAKLAYHFYRYELTDAGFRKELGVIYKQYVTIPYDRIQNVDIYRGIWARILGLSDLNIQTAGSSAGTMSGEGRLIGLSKEVAEALRDELIARARNSKTTNQGL